MKSLAFENCGTRCRWRGDRLSVAFTKMQGASGAGHGDGRTRGGEMNGSGDLQQWIEHAGHTCIVAVAPAHSAADGGEPAADACDFGGR
jgi:hypothetical protein